MKAALTLWVEGYFYAPRPFQKLLSLCLLPISWLYCLVVRRRFKRRHVIIPPIPVISIGNLTVGGSGKTPVVIALASQFDNTAVVLRGYGRKSKGLAIVRDKAGLLRDDVKMTGDEAMIYAMKLSQTVVIVSEDRLEGIAKAKELGCDAVFLDDGYSKHYIEKLDVLIDVPTPNQRCLPAGPYRELLWTGKIVRWLREGVDFQRSTKIVDAFDRMSLVTAIARPQRLDTYIPEVVAKHYFPDHHYFSKEALEKILETDGSDGLLVTYKDYVKMRHFNLPIAVLDLTLTLDTTFVHEVESYIKNQR